MDADEELLETLLEALLLELFVLELAALEFAALELELALLELDETLLVIELLLAWLEEAGLLDVSLLEPTLSDELSAMLELGSSLDEEMKFVLDLDKPPQPETANAKRSEHGNNNSFFFMILPPLFIMICFHLHMVIQKFLNFHFWFSIHQ